MKLINHKTFESVSKMCVWRKKKVKITPLVREERINKIEKNYLTKE